MKSNVWETKKLVDLYNVSSGISKGKDFFKSGTPFITYKDVFQNSHLKAASGVVTLTDTEIIRNRVSLGDVILTRTSETQNELGISTVIIRCPENTTVNGFCKILRKKEDNNLNDLYVGYYLRSKFFRYQCNSLSTLTTRASLNNEMISKLVISFPSRNIQDKIANILSSIDNMIL